MKMAKAEFLLFFLTSLVCSSIQEDTLKPNYNSETDGLTELTQGNFKTLVVNSYDVWVVIFELPGPDCVYCIRESGVIKNSVLPLKKKNIKVGYVECLTTEGKALADSYRITIFPTIYIFGRDKEYKEFPIKFPFSPVTQKDFPSAIESFLKIPPGAEGSCGQKTVQSQESNIYELTDRNFEEVVLKCQDPWVVNFYLPETTACNEFTPYFEAAAKEFKGRAKFGSFYKVDSKFAKKYDVFFACVIKLFPLGNKDKPVDFNGGWRKDKTELIPWIKTALA